MKKLFAMLLAVAMMFSMAIPAMAAPVPVRSLTAAEEEFVQDNFDLDYGWEFIRWMAEDVGPRSGGSYGMRKVMDKAMAEWESFGYEVHRYVGPAAAWSIGGTQPTDSNNTRKLNTGYIEIQGKTDKSGDPLKIVYAGTQYAADTVYKFSATPENRWDKEGAIYKNDVTGLVILDWAGDGANGAPTAALTIPEGVDVAGKSVLVRNMTNTPAPTSTTAVALNNPGATLYYESALALQNAGAAAVIFQTAKPSPSYKITQDDIPGVEINAGNNSFSRITNKTTGEGITNIEIPVGLTLQPYTDPLFTSMTAEELANVKINYMMEYHDQIYQAWAVKYAKEPTDKTIYFTAHCDSFTSTAPFGPGANDNASGAGLVMAVAKAYANAETDVNLVFYLNDCEEYGLWGAAHFVNLMTDEEKAGFVANYNFDMVATGQKNVDYLSLGTPDATLGNLRNAMTAFDYLWNVPEAVEIAQSLGTIYNTYAYVAPRTGLLLPEKIIFTQSTGSDHRNFFQAATYYDTKYPNMTNAWHFDWRRRPWGKNEFEAVYHKIGDDMAGMSRERFDIAAEVAGLTLGYDLGVLSGPIAAGVPAFWFGLEADKELLLKGDTVAVTPDFGNALSSNAAILNFKFDKDIFTYNSFESDAINLVNVTETEDGMIATVANTTEYNLTNLGTFNFDVADDFEQGTSTIELVVEYAFKAEDGTKEAATAGAGYEFTLAVPKDSYTLIDLSDIIDLFGVTNADEANWPVARFFDFNSSGDIDIADISYIASLVD